MKETFVERRPVASLVLLFMVMMTVYTVAGVVAYFAELAPIAQGILGTGVLLVIGLRIIARNSWWQETGLGPTGRQAWLLAWLPLLGALTPLRDGWHVTATGEIGLLLIMAALVGLAEEIWFRGLFMQLLKRYGQVAMLLWPTLLFGFAHSLNVLNGQSLLITVLQIAHALAIGFLMAVLRLKTGSLWPLITAHAALDFLTWVSQGEINANVTVTGQMLVIPAILTLAYLVNAVWLLRSRAAAN